MIGTLFWKEYREHRGLWLGLAALAVGLSFGLGLTLPPQGLSGIAQDPTTRASILVMLVSFAIGYPLVCGALLLAGERDGGTADFLHRTAANKRGVWRTKVGAGVLFTATQTLLLGLLAGVLILTPNPAARWDLVAILPFLGLDALVWGLLASALCRTVLGAVAAAIGLWTGSWMATVAMLALAGTNFGFFAESAVVKTGLDGLALVLCYRSFCWVEQEQRAAALTAWAPFRLATLIWLMVRQGGIELSLVGVLALAGGGLGLQPLLLWPLLSTSIGLICGFAAFGHEQARGEEKFFGTLRLPPRQFWLIKVGFWALTATAALMLAYVIGYFALEVRAPLDLAGGRHLFQWAIRDTIFALGFNVPLFLCVWPIHGFCFGLLFSVVFRRTIMAVLFGSLACATVLVLWTPSMVLGGLATWQLFIVPLMLLLASRWAMWPWIGGRLLSGKPLVSVIVVGIFAIGSVALGLWYRLLEIPDLGEPFDVTAYRAELDAAAKNPAGGQLRQAALDFKAWRDAVDKEIGPVMKPFRWDDDEMDEWLKIPWEKEPYSSVVSLLIDKGWPRETSKLDKWLDRMMEGKWANDFQNALAQEPGLLYDLNRYAPQQSTAEGEPAWHLNEAETGYLWVYRGLQRLHQGKTKQALADFGVALRLTRQLWRHIPSGHYLDPILALHTGALFNVHRWAQKVGPDKALIREALELVQHQEQAQPTTLQLRQGHYLLVHESASPSTMELHGRWDQKLFALSLRVPWEQERRRRLINQIAVADDPEQLSAQAWRSRGTLRNALEGGFWTRTSLRKQQLIYLRGLQLQLALMLYHLDHGQAAAKLDALVPDYLPEVPVNPFTDEYFEYRISKGEGFERRVPGVKSLLPGQGVVWTTTRVTPGVQIPPFEIVVPVLDKKN